MSSVDNPSEARLLKEAVTAAMGKLQVSLPGKVVSYDEVTKTAVVQPAVYDSTEPPEPIEGVPVIFPSGGGYRLLFPLAAGDEVELVFSALDPGPFRATGEPSLIDYVRKGGFYATAHPGKSSDVGLALSLGVPGALHLGQQTMLTDIIVEDGSITLGGILSVDFVSMASRVDAALTALTTWAAAHTHSSGGAGPPAAPPPPPTPTGSVVIKGT